jgi:hypothetical protein
MASGLGALTACTILSSALFGFLWDIHMFFKVFYPWLGAGDIISIDVNSSLKGKVNTSKGIFVVFEP